MILNLTQYNVSYQKGSMQMKYNKYWGCMHDNPHHSQIHELAKWVDHMKKIYDFWPIAYYPYGMIESGTGLKIEGLLNEQEIEQDWQEVCRITQKTNQEGYPMFIGYEWQGNGKDGDHNVFFLENEGKMKHPLTYQELYQIYRDQEVIAIPHHVAYHLGDRGKNWATHHDDFSPFVEVYSSHGCSEADDMHLPMTTHIHMGPRVHQTSYEYGIQLKKKVGCIASGDNHLCPGAYQNGSMCVLASDRSKKAIWEGLKAKRVYGVSFGRMQIDFSANGAILGEEIKKDQKTKVHLSVIGDHAIDRIDLLKDNIVSHTYIHSGKWEKQVKPQVITFKFMVEFGWGPDMRIFPDIYQKHWDVQFHTKGTINSVQRCFNTFGQEVLLESDHDFHAHLTSHKASGAGKWMGVSQVKNEGFVFEITCDLEDSIELKVDGKLYQYPVKTLFDTSVIEADLDGAHQLIEERFGKIESERNDTWYHNAYKFKIHQAVPLSAYQVATDFIVDTTDCSSIRCKIYQKNGAMAWVSPIFMKE